MNYTFIFSNVVLFVLLMDPFGNLPLFVSILKTKTSRQYRWIVIRESFFALMLMLCVLGAGRWFIGLLGLSTGILQLSGGLVLLLMSLKMVFSSVNLDHKKADSALEKEPYIVPLAVPLICGPGTMAMLMSFLRHSPDATVVNSVLVVLLAWLVQGIILFFGKEMANLLGAKMMDALESLMGLLLTSIAVGMLVAGIHEIYRIPAVLP